MPIRIPDALPATDILERENIFVMTEFRAMHQDIRPLRVLLLNLMPTKIATETQIMRKLSNTPLQVDITLLRMATHDSKNTSEEHLDSFYRTFDEVRNERFDGMIITGAPVETLDFEDVDYWPELCEIMDWTCTNVHSTLHICWGAQAGIFHHYGVAKYALPEKLSGVYEHHVVKGTSPLVRGFDDVFYAPHSRYTEVRAEDIEADPRLELIAVSDKAGVYIAKSVDSRRFFVFGHPEYDRDTLNSEYVRDMGRGIDPAIPLNYYPDDDPSREPEARWYAHAQLLYTNWLNYYVYQTTPYDVALVGADDEDERMNPRLTEESLRHLDAEGAVARAGVPLGRTVSTGTSVTIGDTAVPEFGGFAVEKEEVEPVTIDRDVYARAENEDDDGYDPWSDRIEEDPLFEEDPWQ